MGSEPLTIEEFVAKVEELDEQLAKLTEEEAINVILNLLKLTVERHGSFPLFVIDAAITLLNARIFFDPSLAPGSRRVDN